MTPAQLNNYSLSPGYPGGYIPNPQIFETLSSRNSVEDQTRNNTNISIQDKAGHYKVELVIPGFKRENLLVRINENYCLSVTAIHSDAELAEAEKYQQYSVNRKSFTREIILPEDIDTDFVRAEYRSGVLSIWFLKADKPYSRRASMIIVY